MKEPEDGHGLRSEHCACQSSQVAPPRPAGHGRAELPDHRGYPRDTTHHLQEVRDTCDAASGVRAGECNQWYRHHHRAITDCRRCGL